MSDVDNNVDCGNESSLGTGQGDNKLGISKVVGLVLYEPMH